MNNKNWNQVCAWSLATILACTLPSCGVNNDISSAEQLNYSNSEILAQLAQANIVYLGEIHDSLADHKAQLEIIQALYQERKKVAIALEMFQRPFQPVLDSYLAGEIREEELRQQSEYAERWGYDWEFYAPILRFAKAHQLPVLALNTPSEVTRKVAKQGLESLTAEERRYLPPLAEIDTSNSAYRQMLEEIFLQHAHGGQGNSKALDLFVTAQVLWDETMAEKIADFYLANEDYLIVVLAGRGHIIYDYGIPSRVERRLSNISFKDYSVFVGELAEGENQQGQAPADFFWNN